MSSPHGRARAAGFTLVEMLVSLLIFAIIATVATAFTVGATRSFARSDSAIASVESLAVARALLAADLGQAARRPSLAADGKPMPAFTVTPGGFVLVRHRDGALPAIEKVAWGLEDGRLLRQAFPAIDGAPPGDAVAIAGGFRALQIRVAGPAGWQQGWSPADPDELPSALELTLLRPDGEPVVLKLLVAR